MRFWVFLRASDTLHWVRVSKRGFRRLLKKFLRIFSGFQRCYAGVFFGFVESLVRSWGPRGFYGNFRAMSGCFRGISETSSQNLDPPPPYIPGNDPDTSLNPWKRPLNSRNQFIMLLTPLGFMEPLSTTLPEIPRNTTETFVIHLK